MNEFFYLDAFTLFFPQASISNYIEHLLETKRFGGQISDLKTDSRAKLLLKKKYTKCVRDLDVNKINIGSTFR